jgi:hypothetical protein
MDVIKILVEQGFKFQLIYYKKTDLNISHVLFYI